MARDEVGALVSGWRRHHASVGEAARKSLKAGQDPGFLVLCCSDSRVDVGEIFGLNAQGSVFQVRNVGGLFTRDAEAAFVYALRHLKPKVIMVLHHTLCGGYKCLDSAKTEDEVRRHMDENEGVEAKVNVEAYSVSLGWELKDGVRERLVVEEGARIQANRLLGFLSERYPEVHKKVRGGEILLLTLVYDLDSDEVYVVPERIDGSEKLSRTLLKDLV